MAPLIVHVTFEGEENRGRDAIAMERMEAAAVSPDSDNAKVAVCCPAEGSPMVILADMPDIGGKTA